MSPVTESIGHEEGTGGTETSKYPEEKRAKAYSPSSGERTGKSLNLYRASLQALRCRGCGTGPGVLESTRGVTNVSSSRTRLERRAAGGKSPVGERRNAPGRHPSTAGHANPAGIREVHLPRLNTTQRPIVNQYREGKVKSTPRGELKEPETVRLQAVPGPYEAGGVPIEE